jgi:transposase
MSETQRGRKPKLSLEREAELVAELKARDVRTTTVEQIAKKYGVSAATANNIRNRFKAEEEVEGAA